MGILAVGVVVLVLGGGGYALVRHEYRADKDRRDLADLTRGSPWPRAELRVPAELPRGGRSGHVDGGGFEVSYPVDRGGPASISYAIRRVDERGGPEWEVSCGAVNIVTCTDAGDGSTVLAERDTGNSRARTGVYRIADGRAYVAWVEGTRPELVDRLRRAVTQLRPLTDTELLDLIRPDGYRTDWS
ncbi:hypothetical protein GCM10027610_043290 [Dactylosporangium cerinum]